MWFGGGGPWLAELFLAALGTAFWIGLIALIILGMRWLIRQERGMSPPPSRSAGEEPLEILRRRYAAGEIDDEEYERRRKVLTG
jgi:putative membrane protein